MKTQCMVCERAAPFRFCSDVCFIAWARTRIGIECAICQYEVATGRIGNPHTNKLCDECRAAAENAGWVEQWAVTSLDDDVDGQPVTRTLAEVDTRKGRKPSHVQEQIEALCLTGKRVAEPYIDRNGHSRGLRVYYRPYTNAEMAAIVGCHESTVSRVVNHV